MRLNIDCIRDLLLCIEDHTGLRKSCHFIDSSLTEVVKFTGDEVAISEYQSTLMKKYDNDTLIYHLWYCVEDNLISIFDNSDMQYNICVQKLTPAGHRFLDTIRHNTIWGKTKKVISGFSSISLRIVEQVASQILLECIREVLLSR